MTEQVTLESLAETANIAETLAREIKAPVEFETGDAALRNIALPPGWSLVEKDDEKLCHRPRRKVAKVSLRDADSFVAYTKRHGSLADCTIWCLADYTAGKVDFTAILNDHGEDENSPAWRDHTARFAPEFSEEWNRWNGRNGKPFNQAEFAMFVEENLKDVAAVEGSPSGALMLEMALSFEANQDMKFKSAIRLQNGGVQMSFVQDDDDQTLARMQMFDRFTLGIPVFWNGDAYQVNARLRYRVRDGKLAFWFDLIRQDKVLEAATVTLIENIRANTGLPFFNGKPFAS